MSAEMLGIAIGSVVLIVFLGYLQLVRLAEYMDADRKSFALLLHTIEHSLHCINSEIAQEGAFPNIEHHVSIIRNRITSFTPMSEWGQGFQVRLRRVNVLLMVSAIQAQQKRWVAAKESVQLATAIFLSLQGEVRGK